MKRTVLTTVMLMAVMESVFAVPAYRGIITKTLPDGSTIELLLHGDEYCSYVTTVDGYLVKQTDDGYYQYASMENGKVVSLGVRAVNAALRSESERELLSTQGVFQMTEQEFGKLRKRSVMNKMRSQGGQQRIVRGTADAAYSRNLVILVSFSDEAFTRTNSEFDNQFNQVGYSTDGATGSVKDYFVDNSYGQYSPTFDVYGPVTLSHNKAYYGAHSDDDTDIRPAQMVLDAVRALNNDASVQINWSDYDCDNNGDIDNVLIYFAGYGENMGGGDDCIWPHQWYVGSYNTDIQSDADRTFGGKKLSKYICMNELFGDTGTTMCGIGTICHEFSHALGLMDLYVTDYSSDHKSLGDWDIMCGGSYNGTEKTPAGYSSFERFYLGWNTPTLLNSPVTVQTASTMAENQSYVVTATGNFNNDAEDPAPDIYYILENRQQVKWDTYLPGHGLLVEKIDWQNPYLWYANVGNNDPDNMVVDIIEAGGSTAVDGSGSDPFPGKDHITSYTPYSGYPLTNIAETGGIITFDFMGGGQGVYTVYFNAGRDGVADTASLSQEEIGDTIILPGAQSLEGMDFVGWCYDIEADKVDAGVEGDEFVPNRDMLLHAVYALNGQIVPNNFDDCFVEKFSKLEPKSGQDVTFTIDNYADHKGWDGNLLINNLGILQVGNDYVKGYILTPATGLQGEFQITMIVQQNNLGYLGIVTEDGLASEYLLANKGLNVLYFQLSDVTANSKLMINSDYNSFSIKSIYICGEEIPEGVEDAEEESGAVLIRSISSNGMARVENMVTGSRVRVIDALGRVWSDEMVEGESYEFAEPGYFYIVEVVNGNKREVLK